MNENWINPNIIIGSVAIGDNFFRRDDLVEKIWEKIKFGQSILLAAPRRVGKTSVMQYMANQPTENFKLIFQNIQGIRSGNEFFERFYAMILSCLDTSTKAKNWFDNFKTSKTIKSIGMNGIEFETKPTDFVIATNTLLREINDNQEIDTMVLLLDELPEMLFKINKMNNNDAISILTNLRRWRQQPDMNKKVVFVFAGSVGIHYVVDIIDQRHTNINDLGTIHFEPLSDMEAHNYIDWATQGASITYSTQLKKYLLSKTNYYVPYFINILLDEVNKQAKKANNPIITEQNIEDAFDMVVRQNDYFKDWKKRLKDYMKKADFDFVNEILIHTAHKGAISLQEIFDKAVKHDKTSDYMEFIDNLEKDGYIVAGNDTYRFITPFLSAFWKRNNPIYNS